MQLPGFVAVVVAASFCHGIALAAPVSVNVGSETISIPEPRELVALRNHDSAYYKFNSEMQASSGNRLLAAFLPPADANAADSGKVPSPRDWAIAFSLGPVGGQPVTREQYRKELVPVLDAQLEKMMGDEKLRKKVDAASDQATERLLEGRGADPKGATLRLGVISPLGVYARKDNYYVYGSGTKISVTTPKGVVEEIPLVMVVGWIAVKSRLFAVGVYRRLGSREDIDAAKARALQWAEAIARANP